MSNPHAGWEPKTLGRNSAFRVGCDDRRVSTRFGGLYGDHQ